MKLHKTLLWVIKEGNEIVKWEPKPSERSVHGNVFAQPHGKFNITLQHFRVTLQTLPFNKVT